MATAAGATALGSELTAAAPAAGSGLAAAESGDLTGVANSTADIAGTDSTAGQIISAGGANANELSK